jgi:ribonuclease BN (tRNA processing enzyme)
MIVEFIGVGEAFEPQLGNASYLIRSETNFLVDCGYGVPAKLFSAHPDPNSINAIYITHFHADHAFGIPALLNRWNEDSRKKPVTIIGQAGIQKYINQVIDLGYPSSRRHLGYELNYIETTDDVNFNELKLSFAKTDHTLSNYAIKVENKGISLGISGDGGLTEATRTLFQDCHTLIHEAFGFEKAKKGHASAVSVIDYAKSLPKLKVLALVHIQREERIFHAEDYKMLNEQLPFHIMVPEPGEVISFT